MSKLFLAAGVAALALAAPVAAQGQGGGKGGNKGGHSGKVERGGGKAHARKGEAAKMVRRGGSGQRLAAADRGHGKAHKMARQQVRNDDRGRSDERRAAKAERKDDRRAIRLANNDRRDFDRPRDYDDDFFVPGRGRRIVEGCPPGLMAKGCMPPGQARKMAGTMIPANYRERMLPRGLRDLYRDNDDHYYRLGDGGYVYRVDRRSNLINALLPLFGGGLMTGQQFPLAYSDAMVPMPYQAFYPDTPNDYYRYANGYVYGIDRNSGLIENMIPLLANGYGMGQMLPASYSAYNVPYQYRGIYADNDDYTYRYAPGAIYQVDPNTSLITGIASLLAGDINVGSRLPAGYDVYNVPMAYRGDYYDTADSMYRYNDGYIYQVDPTTRLVTAVINALV